MNDQSFADQIQELVDEQVALKSSELLAENAALKKQICTILSVSASATIYLTKASADSLKLSQELAVFLDIDPDGIVNEDDEPIAADAEDAAVEFKTDDQPACDSETIFPVTLDETSDDDAAIDAVGDFTQEEAIAANAATPANGAIEDDAINFGPTAT